MTPTQPQPLAAATCQCENCADTCADCATCTCTECTCPHCNHRG